MKILTQTYTLPNGIRLIHRHTPAKVSYVGLMVGTGTRDEHPDESGMAHFIEHCVFKGTQKRTARQILNRLENVGGELNAYTTKEETTFYAAVLSRYVERAMELIADMVSNPTFPNKETDKERQVIFDEIESYNDSPSELIYDDYEALIFKGYSLERPTLGSKRTLRKFTQEKVLNFMRERYNTDNMVVFAYTDLPFEKVRDLTERYFTDIPYHPRTFTREQPVSYTAQQATFHKHTHQAHFMLGARAYPLGHEKQLGLYFLNNLLGGVGMNTRLNLALREQRGLVYSIESTYTALSDTGYWAIYFASEPQHAMQCIELIYKELAHLREQPLHKATLHKYLRQLKGQMAIASLNAENEALSMAKQMLYYNCAPTWEDTYAAVESFTADDLQAIAAALMQEADISILGYK